VAIGAAAGFPALVLNGKVFPFLNIAEAMITVGKVLAMDAKIVRHHERPRDENGPD
jgi:lipoprotein signal peptidase